MNKDRIEGGYQQIKGKIKETWGRLTDDDIALLDGKREQFFGKVQEKYGLGKDEAERQVRAMEEDARRSSGRAA